MSAKLISYRAWEARLALFTSRCCHLVVQNITTFSTILSLDFDTTRP